MATFCRRASYRCPYSLIRILRMTILALPVIFPILIILSKSGCSLHMARISRTSRKNSSTPISSSPFNCGIHAIASLARKFGEAKCGKRSS